MSRRKLTPEVVANIARHLEKARPLTTACRLEGQKYDTLRELMENNEEVREIIERARAIGENGLLEQLGESIESGKSAGGVTWWLEKLYPKRWGKAATQRVEQTGKDGRPIAHEVTLTIEDAIRGASEEE